MGVTDFEADDAINRQIDELMHKIYREKILEKRWRSEPKLLNGKSRWTN